MMLDISFYKNKRVLVTGHTGFKGSWMSKLLIDAGANVTGYSLEAPTSPSLFHICGLSSRMLSIIGDIRDLNHLKQVFEQAKRKLSSTWLPSQLSAIPIKTLYTLMKLM